MPEIDFNKDISIILDTLWEIKDNDKFYFETYGKEMITELVKMIKLNK